MTTTDAGLSSLVTQLGRARASAMDVPAVLGSICSAIPGVLGVGGALLLLVDPPEGVRELTASDARAAWIGETQQQTDMGPLAGALRTWRPMLTADLTRIGPPAVAGAAAECGLGSSLVLPFDVDGDRVGVLQLLGEVQRPVEAAHAEMLRPLLDVLGARLADVRALRRTNALRPADPAPTHTGAAPNPTPPTGRIGPPAPAARAPRTARRTHRPGQRQADPGHGDARRSCAHAAEPFPRARPAHQERRRGEPRRPPSPPPRRTRDGQSLRVDHQRVADDPAAVEHPAGPRAHPARRATDAQPAPPRRQALRLTPPRSGERTVPRTYVTIGRMRLNRPRRYGECRASVVHDGVGADTWAIVRRRW